MTFFERRRRILVTALISALALTLSTVAAVCPQDSTSCAPPPAPPALVGKCQNEVMTWAQLRAAVNKANADDPLILCGSTISKSLNETPIELKKKIEVVCDGCVIEGPGSHFIVKGSKAEVVFRGVTFMGATTRSIWIKRTVTKDQKFIGCTFKENKGPENKKGGAIQSDPPSAKVVIDSCLFCQNSCKEAGAIFNKGGQMMVIGSRFHSNRANKVGGAIKSLSSGWIEIKDSTFCNNKGKNGPISLQSAAGKLLGQQFVDGGGNVAGGNDSCQGYFWQSCTEFSDVGGATFLDGETLRVGNLNKRVDGIHLSEGLEIRVLAVAGQPITLKNGEDSEKFHQNADGAGCIGKNDDSGTYYYVSNAENVKGGGVYSLEMSSEGDVVEYKNLISTTKRNCGGGRSPYGTWLTCEEVGGGHVWDCLPNGSCNKTRLGGESGGRFEAVAYCCHDGCYYVTEDHPQGALRKFCPNPGVKLEEQLYSDGFDMSYLMLKPKDTSYKEGHYSWNDSFDNAKKNAESFYPSSEGISCRGKFLHFTTKVNKMLLTLNLETGEYRNETTSRKFLGSDGVLNGQFLHQPDQIMHMENHVDVCPENNTDDDPDLLLFAEDGGKTCGLYIRDEDGNFCALVEADKDDPRWKGDETSGICRSPDGTKLHFVIQTAGYLFELTRSDKGKFSKLKCA